MLRFPSRVATLVASTAFLLGASCGAEAADRPAFYRAVNLGGPALVIDGNSWEPQDAAGVVANGEAFENQKVPLIPATDDSRARMIRSSRWSRDGKARVALTDVPAGTYSVYLYLWEDNNPETFDIHLAGKRVAEKVDSGRAGQWQRLGPWVLDVAEGKIEIAADGGAANLSGIEVWHGRLNGTEHPLKGLTPAAGPSRETRAAALLARHCLECHNASDRKGGLDLSRRTQALAGGDSGPALKPGDAAHSTLVSRIDAAEMPPKGRAALSAGERTVLREWIDGGAKWDTDPIDPFLTTSDRRAGYNWWSLQPLKNSEPPEVADASWPVNAIDRFVLYRLEQANVPHAPPADRRTLIRRLSFDLTGLPPTPDEVEAFASDPELRAYERLVDRLLDSPHYGERWARHWLDVVRYGESQGFERNKFRESAWKYRDFVVEAFNSDIPYDEFIRWQLAGDVLHPDDPLAVIASGFLALGPYDLTAYTNGTPAMQAFAREEELEGLVATVGQTFLGLTVNCARCHDHKFDPVTQREFYQFSAALGGTFQGDERESVTDAGKPAVLKRIETLRTEIDSLREQEQSADSSRLRDLAAQRSRRESLIRLLEGGKVHTTVPRQPGRWPILARGDYRQPGETVVPAGIAAVSGVSSDWKLAADAPEAARRKALAEWIASERNPLTSRVIVNRLWGRHFGQGLVATESDFGFQGGSPSHPELLDWLAGQLVHPGEGKPWSLKQIQRLIVTSSTYRQSSRSIPSAAKVDADNRLVWHRPAQRLEAEAFRDAVLAVSGELRLDLGGPGFRDFKVSSAGNNETYTVFTGLGGDFNRRSLYRTWVRTGTSPLLDLLDCPDPSVATPRRSVTSTPLQALSLLNDEFMEHYAKKFAERVQQEAGDSAANQVKRAFARAYARQPSQDEAAFAEGFVRQHGLSELCLVLLNANEFLFVD